MGERQPLREEILFSGGMTTDNDVTQKRWTDQENLVPPPGRGTGLKPRRGIEPVLQLSSPESTGCEVFLIELDDVTRTKMLACRNASTGEIIKLGEYTNQAGKAPQRPYSGGFDPDDPNGQETGPGFGDDPPPESQGMTPPYFYLQSSYYWTEGGATFTATVYRAGSTADAATVKYVTANGTGAAGTDYTAASGTLSFAAGETSKTISVTIAGSGIAIDKTFFIHLFDPSDGHYLARPDRAVVHIGGDMFISMRGQSAQLATRTMVLLRYNFAANRAYAHYLNLTSPVGSTVRQVTESAGDILVYSIDSESNGYIDAFSIETMMSEGPAYASTSSPAAAVKHTPRASVEIGDNFGWPCYEVSGADTSQNAGYAVEQGIVYLTAITGSETPTVNVSRLDVRTMTMLDQVTIALPITVSTSYSYRFVGMDGSGYLVGWLKQGSGSSVNTMHFFRVDPASGTVVHHLELTDTTTYRQLYVSPFLVPALCVLESGSVIACIANASSVNAVYEINATMSGISAYAGFPYTTASFYSDPSGPDDLTYLFGSSANRRWDGAINTVILNVNGSYNDFFRVGNESITGTNSGTNARLLLNATAGGTILTLPMTEFYGAKAIDSAVADLLTVGTPIIGRVRNLRGWNALNFWGSRETP